MLHNNIHIRTQKKQKNNNIKTPDMRKLQVYLLSVRFLTITNSVKKSEALKYYNQNIKNIKTKKCTERKF